MKVIKKSVGKPYYVIDIDGSLESYQKEVGGYIETVTIEVKGQKAVIICNEEALIKGLPENATVKGVTIHGDFIITGSGEEDFVELENIGEVVLELIGNDDDSYGIIWRMVQNANLTIEAGVKGRKVRVKSEGNPMGMIVLASSMFRYMEKESGIPTGIALKMLEEVLDITGAEEDGEDVEE